VAEQLWKDAAADLQKRYDFLAQLAGKAEKSPSELRLFSIPQP
jgi:pyruvate-ferredoxin/flavodoxin oxidoreductase